MKGTIGGWPIWARGRLPLDEPRWDVKTAGRCAHWLAQLVLAI